MGLWGCQGRERIVASPCDGLDEVLRRSSGFDPADADQEFQGEMGAKRATWDRVEWSDGPHILYSQSDAVASFRTYDGRLTELYVAPSGSFPIADLIQHVGPPMRALAAAGFEVVEGRPEDFTSPDPRDGLRFITYRRGDYEAWLNLELDDSRRFFRFAFGTSSVGACRSPAMRQWLADDDARRAKETP